MAIAGRSYASVPVVIRGSLEDAGDFGSKTKTAIKKLQAAVGADSNGRIDETVISALQVTPGVLPPGVTAQGRAAVQAQVALDAAADDAKDRKQVATAARWVLAADAAASSTSR